ncbi:MAG TPA: archease [Desulfomonilia bacterium]
MPYSVIDHTADIGLKITGTNMPDLFLEAARALVIEIGADTALSEKTVRINVDGYDYEDLLVLFLNALIFEIQTRDFRVSGFEITSLSKTGIRVSVRGAHGGKPLKENIKAATYHNLNIIKNPDVYETTIIFDV